MKTTKAPPKAAPQGREAPLGICYFHCVFTSIFEIAILGFPWIYYEKLDFLMKIAIVMTYCPGVYLDSCIGEKAFFNCRGWNKKSPPGSGVFLAKKNQPKNTIKHNFKHTHKQYGGAL